MKRMIALCLALLLVFGMAACGETTTTENDASTDAQQTETAAPVDAEEMGFYLHPSDYQGEMPLVPEGEKKTITIGVRTSAKVLDYNDNEFTKWIEEQTGIDVEFMQFSGSASDAATQISLMIASGERLPDILLNIGGINKATAKEYVRDGYFIDLREYMDSEAYYMHEAAQLYFPGEQYDDFADNLMFYITDPATGDVFSTPYGYFCESDELQGHIWINGEWLDNLGLEQPKTVEELYDVLVAFRDQDPNGNGLKDEIPMTGMALNARSNVLQYVINAFIYCFDKYKYIVDDGVVSAPYHTDEYREAMKYLRKLVDEGLLTPLTWTQSSSELQALLNPIEGMPHTVGVVMAPAEQRFLPDSDAMFVFEPLRLLEDATGRGGHGPISNAQIEYGVYITADCEEPLLAFRLIDFLASPEALLRMEHGVLGEDWEYYDDPTGTSGSYGGPARINLLNPTALDTAHRKSWNNVAAFSSDQYWQVLTDVNDGSYTGTMYKKLQEQVKNYKDMGMNQEVMYMFERTEEEDERWNDVNSELNTFIGTARSNFCNGIWDPNSDSDWNDYVATLESLGYFDTWIDVAQSSYDRHHGK
ncbi:MAG: extracellular solute-binding protein [Oscillospiraceae bacterium]|nr:extracellular solute-binding protein [Oscillospiraceae bacterium]